MSKPFVICEGEATVSRVQIGDKSYNIDPAVTIKEGDAIKVAETSDGDDVILTVLPSNTMSPREWSGAIVYAAIVIIVVYVTLAALIYRFNHPQMTETELFLHIPDALLFR